LTWKLTPAAEMVWEQLRSPVRSEMRKALAELAERPELDSGPKVRAIRVGKQLVKVLRAPRGYRVFFERDHEGVVVVDIASPAQIEFLRPARESTAA
jgi:mRNA-degrading endonuclease RelE of RelBE toxin-antitoxin system